MTPDNDLFKKFYAKKLHPDELTQLRELVDQMSDQELELQLLNAGVDAPAGRRSRLDADSASALRERLVEAVERKSRRRRLTRYAAVAAAVMLPVVAAVAVVMGVRASRFDLYQEVIDHEHTICTATGEELLTMLPDGSKVRMGPESELRYSLASFNAQGREVDWAGEGVFTVVRNADAPFALHAPGFDIRVLGTTFAVEVRSGKSEASVFLETGAIELSTRGAGSSCRLSPGYLATISRATGEISVRYTPEFDSDINAQSLNFYGVALSEVLDRLALYYPKRFYASSQIAPRPFTGSLPKGNLDEAVTIIQKAYGAKAEVDAETVSFLAGK